MQVDLACPLGSANRLMSIFVNELGSQDPAPCKQSTRSVHAAVPKDYESDFWKVTVQLKFKKKAIYPKC